ncbi:hypothetical protein DY000_02054294 [Brassica cretica]|uniref:Uncharacterized protein n=1 Tax=Brassica cretica TaxID=69181 RepID=A0ABQ7AJQ5_BRACR|nr:hypothetical protein DY000_02054294 [Brassica cretica]
MLMKLRCRWEANRQKGRSGILVLVLEKTRVLGVKLEKERGDRVWAGKIAREEGDEIDAEDGIAHYGSDTSSFGEHERREKAEKTKKEREQEKKTLINLPIMVS